MNALKKHTALVLTGISMCLLPVADVQALNPETDCTKEVILAFYPEAFVKNTLSKFKVPQDQWDAIVKELADKDKSVISMVEEKAGKMNPNPLKDPSKQADAVKIFRETLLENFSDVMKKHGVTDEKQLQEMLDDIQVQKAKRFSECFPQKGNDSDDDDNDNDSEKDNMKTPPLAPNSAPVPTAPAAPAVPAAPKS